MRMLTRGMDRKFMIVRRQHSLSFVETVHLEQAESCHHPEHRWQVRNGVESGGQDDRKEKENDDKEGTGLGFHSLGEERLLLLRNAVAEICVDNASRNKPVDEARYQQARKLPELELSLLPNHQGCDVAKRAERTASVACNHDIDARKVDKLRVPSAHRHHDGTQEHRGGEIICYWRKPKGTKPSDPERNLVSKATRDEP
mmetsp:Transcript_9326/g.30774  ORF Transcript_9326/g.30774 Transcript_9326/m.30774 type:complete len:200 (-) Transcript_9326:821-1420(-)